MARESEILKAIEKIEGRIEQVDFRLDSVDKTLIKQEGNLEKHMLRSDHLEGVLALTRKEVKEIVELTRTEIRKLEKDLEPVKKHVNYVEGAFKAIGAIGVLAGLVLSVVKLFF